MIRFARDMQQQTILFDRDQSLRLGTRLKIGIHSGSITAGVVRHDREHRLRLFGDAVAIGKLICTKFLCFVSRYSQYCCN
jgi:class 3 adenylate cyclase